MGLTDEDLAWLRDLHAAAPPVDATSVDRLVELAARTPAWLECYVAIVDRLAGCATSVDGRIEPSCPQLVDVDFPAMAFRRAEWIRGNLVLELAPEHDEPDRSSSFRLVGAEPRAWDVHGPDGVTLEMTSAGLIVRVPCVSDTVELIRGSY